MLLLMDSEGRKKASISDELVLFYAMDLIIF